MPIELKLDGDRELWAINGSGVGGTTWSIPVFADPFSGEVKPGQVRRFYRISPAAVMDLGCEAALRGRLIPYNVDAASGMTLVTEKALHEIATKAQGITPSYYLKWGPDGSNPGKVEEESVDADYDKAPEATEKFIEYVYTHTQVASHSTLKLVWRAITQCAFDWLAVDKRPISFGFMELTPIPYRINWAQMLKAMFPGSPPTVRLKNKVARDARLLDMGFMGQMTNGILLGMDNNAGVITWRVECTLQKNWWQRIIGLEQKIKATLGPVQYSHYVFRQMFNRRDKLLELYAAWVKEANRPAGTNDDGRLHGGKALICWLPPGKIKPVDPPCGAVEAVVDSDGAEISGPGGPSIMAIEATKRLLEMSDL